MGRFFVELRVKTTGKVGLTNYTGYKTRRDAEVMQDAWNNVPNIFAQVVYRPVEENIDDSK